MNPTGANGALTEWLRSRRPSCVLLAVAAPREADAVFRGLGLAPPAGLADWSLVSAVEGIDVVRTGVGKANAAGAVARSFDPARHAAVVSVGVAGALPGSPARLGEVVLATSAAFADEGVATPHGFIDLAQMGLPLGEFAGAGVPVDPMLLECLAPVADHAGPIATVSTCSGSDELAWAVAARTGALAEAMEGAAVASTALRLGVPAAELRVISNTTGRRDRQRWDLPGALERLARVIGRL